MVDVDPIRRLAADFGKESRAVGPRAGLVVRATASRIAADAKIMAPVDTGNLRNSIGYDLSGGEEKGTMRAEVGPTANYGGYVELGTSKMGAQPYLFPAADRHEPAFIQAMTQAAEPKL